MRSLFTHLPFFCRERRGYLLLEAAQILQRDLPRVDFGHHLPLFGTAAPYKLSQQQR